MQQGLLLQPTHFLASSLFWVIPPPRQSALERGGFLRPDALNNSNRLELFVFANDKQGQARA